MEIRPWAKKYLKITDLKSIAHCVAQAEKLTSGEIVPMIVKRSSHVDHIPPMLLMLLGFVCFFGIEIFLKWFPAYSVQAIWIFIMAIVFVLFLTRILAQKSWVQYFFVSRFDRESQVNQRAKVEFYNAHLNHTQGSTGVLLFVSLMERYAVVLADEAVSSRLPASTWGEIVNTMVEGAKRKDLAGGMCQAIEKCQVLLSAHFPPSENDINELSDRLILKD